MLKEIKGTILKDTRKEGEEALRKAEEEVEGQLARVKSEGEEKVSLAEREARAMVESERRERLSWAKLEGRRVLAEAKEDAVREAFDSLISRVKAYCGTRPYAAKMKEIISAAAKEVGGKAVVHVRRKDRKLLAVQGADTRGDADILGGAIVESRDGKLRIDLSMEALLEANRDAVRKEIYSRMFR